MPGLSQLKKFSEDMLSLGNEPALRSARGERPVTVPIPKDVKDVNDSDDFIMGMPQPVEYSLESSKKTQSPEDFSDITGTDSETAQTSEDTTSNAAPEINLSVPDLSSMFSGAENGNDVDLSMFDEPVETEEVQEEEPVEEEKEPEIADLSLEDLLSGEGFDGSSGKDENTDETPNENADTQSTNDVTELDADDVAELDAELEPEVEPKEEKPAQTAKDEAEESVDDIIAKALGNNDNSFSIDNPSDTSLDTPSTDSDFTFEEPNAIQNENPFDSPDVQADSTSDLKVDEDFKTSDFGDIQGLDLDVPDFSSQDDFENKNDTTETSSNESSLNETSLTEPSNPDSFENPADDFEYEADHDFDFDGSAIDLTEGLPNEMSEADSVPNSEDFVIPESDIQNESTENTEPDKPADSIEEDYSVPEGLFDSSDTASTNDSDFENKTSENETVQNETAEPLEKTDNDFPSGFDFNFSDTDSSDADSPDTFQEQAPTETFDTSAMEGLDFGIPDTDSAIKDGNFELGDAGDFAQEPGDFEIPGFSDVQTVEVNKNGKIKIPEAEKKEKKERNEDGELPPNSLTDEQYKKFVKNLMTYPLNVRMAVEELIVKNEFTDEAEFEIIQKVLKKVSARQLASELEKMLDIAIPVPRDFERRTAEEYEAYKASFQYQLSNKIIPGAILSFASLVVFFFMFQFVRFFVYEPARANSLYRQGYKLIESENFPQSEAKFNEAVKYQSIKKWFFKYANGYKEHKQFIRAEEMYKKILHTFNFDKTAGLEYAEMEYKTLANYEKAEEILLRAVLDYHINDADGILMLGDTYLEWADEKDSSKYEEAYNRYAQLVQLYGSTDKYMSRLMRYYIRTDNLKEVLNLKGYFFPRVKSLEGEDWTELSGYCLEKLYGHLSPSDEYLRSKIEDVKELLVRAIQTDSKNPVPYYNLGQYFINTKKQDNAEKALLKSISFFEKTPLMKKKVLYKNIDAYRLLGEVYTGEKEYLKAMESFTDGITLFSDVNTKSGLEPNSKIGNLYSDMGDIAYFISGDYDSALQNYKDSVNYDYDNGKIRYKIGFIQYSKKNYPEAIGSFMKASEDYPDDRNLLLAMGNALSLRDDNFAAEGYYERLVSQVEDYKAQQGKLFPQTKKDDNEIIESYLRASNNLGVTLYRLAKRTGSSSMNASAMVNFQNSLRAWDSLTRNQKTMVRLPGSNLGEQNLKYATSRMPDFEPAIYTDISKTLTIEQGLSQ